MKSSTIAIAGLVFALTLATSVLALPIATFDSSSPSNNTFRNGTVGLSFIIINVTSNETINANASSYIQWYNETNASTNFSALVAQTVNRTSGQESNWTWWEFNLANDGVHRFDVILHSNVSGSGHSAVVQRYVYYDNTTPSASIAFPVDGTDYVRSPPFNFTLDLNFTGDTNQDVCQYDVNNGGNVSISCSNGTFVSTPGSNSLTLWVNDSAGNLGGNSLTFTARETSLGGTSGGGGGGGSGFQIQAARVTTGVLPANSIQVVPVTTQNVPVTKFEFRTTKDVLLNVDIRSINTLPVPDPPGKVIHKLDITPTDPSGMVDVAIHFKVSKFDLNKAGVSTDNVVLMRYANSWFTLPTDKVNEDSLFVHYRAVSPGFSYFAISSGLQGVGDINAPVGTPTLGIVEDLGNFTVGDYDVPIALIGLLILGLVVLIVVKKL